MPYTEQDSSKFTVRKSQGATVRLILSAIILFAPICASSNNRILIYPIAESSENKLDWVNEIRNRVSPLTNVMDGRWPLALWRTIPLNQISREVAEMLLTRGLVPALPLDRSSIHAAQTLRSTGAPIILTSGSGAGSIWPYNLEQDRTKWEYRFPDQYPRQDSLPVPTLFSGWSIAATEIKKILQSFREAGVVVNAAWLDYEGLPFQSNYIDATRSLNGPEFLPAESMRSPKAFTRYTRQLWVSLVSTYIAAPIREVYPRISVTNWLAVLSLPGFPVISWYEYPLPMVGPNLFTSTNPVAYGVDTAFNARAKLNGMSTQRDVDRIYTEILLRQVSADSYARHRIAPELEQTVWIARWVRDNQIKLTPMMSRSAYREALRHLWLRGVDAMEIFSPVRKGYEDLAIQEVEDASTIFNEMLAYEEFLSSGTVLNYRYRIRNQKPVLWSGMKLENQAIIRVVSLNGRTETVTIDPWSDGNTTLRAPDIGATYFLFRDPGQKIRIQKIQ